MRTQEQTPLSRSSLSPFFFKATLAALFFSSLPYLYGVVSQRSDARYTGFSTLNSEDFNLYLSFVEQARQRRLFFCNRFTSEDLPCTLFLPLFAFIGFLARLLQLPSMAVVHLARGSCALFLCLLLYRLCGLFSHRERERNLQYLCLLFSSGLGGYLLLGRPPEAQAGLPLDVGLNPANTFLSLLFTFPIYTFSQSLLLVALFFLVRALSFLAPRPAFIAGSLSALLLLVHPYDVLLVCSITLLLIGLRCAAANNRRKVLLIGLIFFAPLLPACFAQLIGYLANPFVRGWAHQERLVYSLGEIGSAYGLLWPLAFFAAIRSNPRKEPFLLLALGWIGAAMILSRIPFLFPDRMLNGLHIPIALLAGRGLALLEEMLVKRWSPRRAETLVHGLLILTTFSNIAVLVNDVRGLREKSFPYYLSADWTDAFLWIKENLPETSVVLASYAAGNFIPARTRSHAFVGHSDATLKRVEKVAALRCFFAADTTDQTRRHLLRRYGVTHVLHSDEERRVGPYDPSHAPWLELVFKNNALRLYRVKEEKAATTACGQNRPS